MLTPVSEVPVSFTMLALCTCADATAFVYGHYTDVIWLSELDVKVALSLQLSLLWEIKLHVKILFIYDQEASFVRWLLIYFIWDTNKIWVSVSQVTGLRLNTAKTTFHTLVERFWRNNISTVF